MELSEKFLQIKSRCSHIPTDIVEEYFPNGGYNESLDKFFAAEEKTIQAFYQLTYPFIGKKLFDDLFFNRLVRKLPEFIVSLIKFGVDRIITLKDFRVSDGHIDIVLSYETLTDASEVVLEITDMLHAIEKKQVDKLSLADLDGLIDRAYCLTYSKPFYDLLGTIQILHQSIIITIESLWSMVDPYDSKYIHAKPAKSSLLYEIVGDGSQPAQMYASNESPEKRDEILSIIAEYLRLHWYPGSMTTQGQLQPSQTTIPDSEDKSKFPVLGSEKDEISIEEPTTNYGDVNGLILHLPEDQTTDQSPVYLDFMSSESKIADIKLSHMEAALLYYLGAERNAKETLWLSFPEKQSGVLRQIWKSFCLPEYFEDELALIPPIKGITRTWIWDFDNVRRKNLRNNIQKHIKPYPQLRDLKLVVSYKSSESPYGGNYKLNSQIKSFEIIPPSR